MSETSSISARRLYPAGEPNASLIALLEQMLDEAKSGELQTFMGVGVTANGSMLKCFSRAAHREYFVHLGALEDLKHDFIKREAPIYDE